MRKSTRMAVMNMVQKDGSRDSGRRWDREYSTDVLGEDYGMELKFRDRDGRERYDNGRYASMRSEYMPAYSYHNEYDEHMDDNRNYPSPVYQRRGGTKRSNSPMNKIGFALKGEMERKDEMGHEYRSDSNYHNVDNEMNHRRGGKMSSYANRDDDDMHLTREMAREWTDNMENENGTHGAHWSLDQAQKAMAEREIDGSPIDFWVAINMMYSDYCEVAKKFGVSNLDFYACMAKAFMEDKDAAPNKLALYYEYIVR